MGLTDSIIETGVDKLVKLVNEKGKVSSFDAAKELGVSNTVVMEWADFLEEEGIISIEYKFTKQFLVPRKLGKKEVQEKAKEFSGKKDVFVRKAEVSLSFLDKEAAKLNSIKEEFDKIKKELGWQPSVRFAEGLGKTVDWYLGNPGWVANVKSGAYKNWIKKNYTR